MTDRKFLAALALGAGGGAVFWLLNAPLAWMLGAMTATVAGALLRLPISGSNAARAPMIAVMGALLGTSFSADMAGRMVDWIIPMAMLVPFIVVAGGTSWVYLNRVAGIDRATAFYSAMPGGLVDMILLGERDGADGQAIALMHGSRIFLVVMLFPWVVQFVSGSDISGRAASYRPLGDLTLDAAFWFAVAAATGGLLGTKLRLPAPLLIGPMLVSAALHVSGVSDFVVPTVIVWAAQVVLGTSIGCRFAGRPAGFILRILRYSVGTTVVLLVATVLFASLVAHLTGIPFEELLLAYSPGGLAEMSLIAFTLGLDVPFVAAHHIARIFLTVAGVTLLARLRPGR